MESFSLLRYWRGRGGAAGSSSSFPAATTIRTTPTTIAASLLRPSPDSDAEDDCEGGPFFDLEFAAAVHGEDIEDDDAAISDEEEFKFSVSPNGHCSDSSSLSPSDDLFFKGRLVPLALEPSAEPADSRPPPQFNLSLKRSATKLGVLMLRLRKPKSCPAEAEAAATSAPASPKQNNKFFFKLEEVVPIVSLFTRDNSSKTTGRAAVKPPHAEEAAAAAVVAEERRFTKEGVQKYLSKIKPLYVREKLRLSGLLSSDGEAETVVRKRLGKSRSAPSTVAAVASAKAAEATAPPVAAAQRRDDSLLQQQDGIQSAIAHCKKSFNGDRGSESMSDGRV